MTRALSTLVLVGGLSLCVWAGPQKESPKKSKPAGPQVCQQHRILFLSDSQGLGPYGEFLEDWFASIPNTQYEIHSLGGANPSWWTSHGGSPRVFEYESCSGKPRQNRRLLEKKSGHADPIDTIVAEEPVVTGQELLIFSLGGWVPGEPEIYEGFVSEFMKHIHKHRRRHCVWITPAVFSVRSKEYQDRVVQAIRKGMEGAEAACLIVDPRPFAKFPKRPGEDPDEKECDHLKGKPEAGLYDGIHYPFTCTGELEAHKLVNGIKAAIQREFPAWSSDSGLSVDE